MKPGEVKRLSDKELADLLKIKWRYNNTAIS
jgi:hypothetical protein